MRPPKRDLFEEPDRISEAPPSARAEQLRSALDAASAAFGGAKPPMAPRPPVHRPSPASPIVVESPSPFVLESPPVPPPPLLVDETGGAPQPTASNESLFASPQAAPRSHSGRSLALAAVVSIVTIALIVFALRRPAQSPPPSPKPTVVGTTPAAPTPSVEPVAEPRPLAQPEPVAAAKSDIPPEKGRLLTASTPAGFRVFVDEKVAGNTPDPILVTCGSHVVQVGSKGRPVKVDVPCGGEVAVHVMR